MLKKDTKKAQEETTKLFERAKVLQSSNPKLSKRAIRKAFKLAAHAHLRLRKERQLFCRRCWSLFTSQNSRRRVKHKILTITCLECGAIHRYRLG